MDPAEAVVKPGCKQQVSVVFRAEANRVWTATLGLDISERDHRDQPDGIPYELGGDSCIPGGLMEALSSQLWHPCPQSASFSCTFLTADTWRRVCMHLLLQASTPATWRPSLRSMSC